jgi:hypothetical protein
MSSRSRARTSRWRQRLRRAFGWLLRQAIWNLIPPGRVIHIAMTEYQARLLPPGPIRTPTCRHCGQDIPPRSRYCLWCGQRLRAFGPATVLALLVPVAAFSIWFSATRPQQVPTAPVAQAVAAPAAPGAGAFNSGAILPCGHLSESYSSASAPPIVWCRYGHRFYWASYPDRYAPAP